MEGCLVVDSNQTLEQHQEAKELQGTSDTEVAECVSVCLSVANRQVKQTSKSPLNEQNADCSLCCGRCFPHVLPVCAVRRDCWMI